MKILNDAHLSSLLWFEFNIVTMSHLFFLL